MKQEKIKYRDIMDLCFKEEIHNDPTYFDECGFDYAIVTRYLTKKIYLDWEKETQLCKIVRIDNKRECNIMAESPVMNLEHLKAIIGFFAD